MRKAIIITTVLAAGVLIISGCSKKTTRDLTGDELKKELAGIVGELDAYFAKHNFYNTNPAEMQSEADKAAEKFAALEGDATKLKAETGDPTYDDVAALAGEGRIKAETLADAVAAGLPGGDEAKKKNLYTAIDDWAEYSNKISAAPVTEAPVGEDEPDINEPEKAEPDTSGYPGKGHHYGWWKNPEWARDPASTGTALPPGLREKDRERNRDGTGPDKVKGWNRDNGGCPYRDDVEPGDTSSTGGPGKGPGGGKGHGKGRSGK